MSHKQSFQILRISSCSDLPIRNTANELIFGSHILWEGKDTLVDDGGSLAPNAFAYDFTSPLATNSTLNVALKVVNNELFGKDLILRGSLASDSNNVFESAVFTTRNAEETTIAVSIVDPNPCPRPFSLNGDFVWVIVNVPKAQKHADGNVEYASVNKTQLELYWISPDIHEIFYAGLSGIAIKFLRVIFYPDSVLALPQDTQAAFSDYHKMYDTIDGASQFGVSSQGGKFEYERYIEGGGNAYPYVGCYDQTAMVQLLGTVAGYRPTWLFLQPFGYINQTNLVGVPGLCNNPYFNSNATPQDIDIDNPRRTKFDNHSFNGVVRPFNPLSLDDRIYDATSGPALGISNPQEYLNVAIDRVTTLPTKIGTVQDIKQYGGITNKVLRLPRLTTLKDEDVEKMLHKYATGNAKPCSQVRWDDLSQWVKTVLGDTCDVAYHKTDIGDGIAMLLWHLTGIDGVDGDVIVRVRVETHVAADGSLDYQQSSQIAFDDLISTLLDVPLDLGPNHEHLHTLWVPAPFGNYAQYALQCAPHIPKGRVHLLCGNCLISISGGSSSAALEPVVQKLLAYTTVTNTPVSLNIPRVSKHFYEIGEKNKGLNSPNEVKGLFTSFNVKCHVDDLVVAATVDSDTAGVLLSKYNVEKNEANKTSRVTFTFMTRTVGVHDVNLRFKKALTMTTNTKTIQVTVVEG